MAKRGAVVKKATKAKAPDLESLTDRVGRIEKELMRERREALRRVSELERQLDTETRQAMKRVSDLRTSVEKAEKNQRDAEEDVIAALEIADTILTRMVREPRVVGCELDRFVWRVGKAISAMRDDQDRNAAAAAMAGGHDEEWIAAVREAGEVPFTEDATLGPTSRFGVAIGDVFEVKAPTPELSGSWSVLWFLADGRAHLGSVGANKGAFLPVDPAELVDQTKWQRLGSGA